MRNLRLELINEIGAQSILCAIVTIRNFRQMILKIGFSEEEEIEFWKKLDIEYNNDDILYSEGTVWLKDGSWIVRQERNSCEWWERISCPTIPKELM